MVYFIQGLLLGLAYVAPIGIQNLYVINSALRGDIANAIKIALIVIFFDITLALACFIGIGILLERYILLKEIMLLFGSVAVLYIGVKLLISKPEFSKNIKIQSSLVKIITACFLVTWFNPQAIIDGSLLLGGYRASLPVQGANLFIFGVCTASFLWFVSLAIITSLFRKVFNAKILRVINIICGIIIIIYGINLGLAFIKLFKF